MAEDVIQRDFHADRQVNFLRKLAWIGRDFTGATFFMQVRQCKDTTGTPLINMRNGTFTVDPDGIALLYAGTATIAAHISAGRLGAVPDAINPATGQKYQSSDSVLLSQILLFSSRLTIRAIPLPAEVGDDHVCYYDLLITPAGGGVDGQEDVFMAGKFIIRAGVSVEP